MSLLNWFRALLSKKQKPQKQQLQKQRTTPLTVAVSDKAEWNDLFRHFQILQTDRFNQANFPLEPKSQLARAKAISFSGEWIPGSEALNRIAQEGNSLAKLRTTLEYISLHSVQPHYPVVAAGAQWVDPRFNQICVPVFQNFNDVIVVSVHFLDGKYIPTTRWLACPNSGKVERTSIPELST